MTVEVIESFCIWLVGKTVSDTTTKIAGKVGQRHPFTYALVATALSLIVPLVLSTSGQRAEVLPQWALRLWILAACAQRVRGDDQGAVRRGGREQ